MSLLVNSATSMEHLSVCQRSSLIGSCRKPVSSIRLRSWRGNDTMLRPCCKLHAKKMSNNNAGVPTEQEHDAASQRLAAQWSSLAEGDEEDMEEQGIPDLQDKLNELCNEGVRMMLSSNLEELGSFKEKLFEYGAVFTDADNKEATMFCYVLFRLTEHQVALAARDLTGNYKEAYEKMFGMLEDSGWQLKMETDGEPDMLDPDLVMPPAEAYSQGY